jgi:spore coat protein H
LARDRESIALMQRSSPILIGIFVSFGFLRAEEPASPATEDALFGFSRIGSALLTFTPEDWKEIKPDEPAGPGGPGGFGPADFLAQSLIRQFDSDKNSDLSREEFTAGFDRWFQAWDAKKAGFLDGDAVRDGMNKDMMPNLGPGPGAPPGGGGPRLQAGPPGITLQAQDGRRNGISGMRGINFEYVHADLEFAGKQFRNVAVRYKGNGTYMDARNSEKKSFKVDLNEFEKGQKLLGLTKLNLHSNITDAAWMNESLAYALYRDAGVPAPRTSYTRLAVSVPGTFDKRSLGLYTFVENPDSNWAKFHFDSKKGLILKPVTRELFIDKGSDWAPYKQAYDAKTDITEAQVRRVTDFAKLVTSASDEDFAARLPEYLDIDEFSRFMAVTVWLSSTDSILMVGQNYVVHLHPGTKKFQFVPWDLDRAFGNFFFPQPEELSVRKAWGDDNRFLVRVMNVPAVRDAYVARLTDFQATLFQPERLIQRIDEMAKLIRPAVAEEGDEKLAKFDRALADQPVADAPAAEQPGPPGFRMPANRPIKAFIKARHQSVADQLAGKSEGRELGGGGFGGSRNAGGGRGPGGGGPGPGGPGGGRFGIGNFLGPVVVKAADSDTDGHITATEFQALSARWFGEWDADADGKLNAEQLRNGITKAFPAPRFGGPGGPSGPPGGPAAPAAPGPR